MLKKLVFALSKINWMKLSRIDHQDNAEKDIKIIYPKEREIDLRHLKKKYFSKRNTTNTDQDGS